MEGGLLRLATQALVLSKNRFFEMVNLNGVSCPGLKHAEIILSIKFEGKMVNQVSKCNLMIHFDLVHIIWLKQTNKQTTTTIKISICWNVD